VARVLIDGLEVVLKRGVRFILEVLVRVHPLLSIAHAGNMDANVANRDPLSKVRLASHGDSVGLTSPEADKLLPAKPIVVGHPVAEAKRAG